ncbi:Lactose Permease [Massospora cicadina]|nr:Lactose Permease [Massospora cicadina]
MLAKTLAPDNHEAGGITINDKFPGPTINVTMGDSLEINVRNLVGHPFTLHWHGIVQKGSPEADGVPYVTQDPIPHNGNYTYTFQVKEQAGTYWYHAHTKLDAEVAYGAFIIMEPKRVLQRAIQLDARFNYDDERVVLLSDLWHKSHEAIYTGLTTVPYVPIGNPQSILTNGGTYAEWDTGANASAPFNDGYSIIRVKPNMRYRLRLIGAQGHSFYSFQIPNHTLTVIEADGTLVRPFKTSRIEINSGMRYSAILETKAKVDNHFMYTSIIGEGDKVTNGIAILHYEGAKDPEPLRKKVHTPLKNKLQLSTWFEDQLSTLISHDYPLPTKFTQSFKVHSQFAIENRLPIHRVNDVTYKERDWTLLPSLLNKTNSPAPGIIDIHSDGQGVQLILQHSEPENRVCAQHPWHMHGHSYYVVARGSGNFDPKVHLPQIEKSLIMNPSPILRDTFTFFPNEVPNINHNSATPPPPPNPNSSKMRSCGWYALRFKANNPGSWLMHCHNTSHMIMGMQFIFNESPRNPVCRARSTCNRHR